MRVILDLDEAVLKTLQQQADAQNRSRKNYMETVLANLATSIPVAAYTPQEPFPKPLVFAKPTGQKKVREELPEHLESDIQYAPTDAESFDSPKTTFSSDEAGQWPEPKVNKDHIRNRIKVLEADLKSPPKAPQIGLKAWKSIRENELAALKKLLN